MSGRAVELLVEEAAEVEVVLERVDVREAGEVADDRGDAGAAPPPRRQQRPRRRAATNLGGDLARELEHVAVQEEEARQAEVADHAQLLVDPRLGIRSPHGAGRVALVDAGGAQLGELAIRVRVLGAGVGVAEIAREVELEPLGQPPALLHGVGMGGEPARPSRSAARARARSCRAAVARTRRASCPAAPRRARPGAAPGRGRARARCRWRHSARRSARRARRAGGCGARRGGRTGAAARSAGARGRRCARAGARPRRPRRGALPRPRARRRPGRRSPRGTPGRPRGGAGRCTT